MVEPEVADAYSMDIAHVTVVELPLIVKNTQKAIEMIGGKDKIAKAINAPDRLTTSTTNEADDLLELRLRKDPFHHPIISSKNLNEKVLLKVSIPKKTLPHDYYQDPSKYTVRELIAHNRKLNGPLYEVTPRAIINKTFSFKGIADFQACTKRNEMIQDFKDNALNTSSYEGLKKFFDNHNNLSGISDYKDDTNYQNRDHHLPPPPMFSPIHFPFDYKFQMNPLTAVVRDKESGEVKVVTRKTTQKLHTRIIDFYQDEVPIASAPELLQNIESLKSSDSVISAFDQSLVDCIEWLNKIFDLKPIWLRKHLEDIVPAHLKRVIKQALPYVSYIYKSGPWRFCNVKFGVNPKSDNRFWIYQSEYFRIPELHLNKKKPSASSRVIPETLKDSMDSSENILVSDNLLFTGTKLPATVTYQIGDIIDSDILSVLGTSKSQLGEKFFRSAPDFQDGWINRQTVETLRKLIRYKLSRIVRDEKIEEEKIHKIIMTDYSEHVSDDMNVENIADSEQDDEEDEVEDEDDIISTDGDIKGDTSEYKDDLEAAVFSKLDNIQNPNIAKLKELVGFVRQDQMI